jgi:hypothetical protein
MPAMNELVPGVMHWSAMHPRIHSRVHSAFHVPSGTLIDPMAPEEGLGWFESHPPERILLTNRHHLRDSEQFVEAFGCSIHCHPAGLHEFEAGGPGVEPMETGDTPAPGITVLEVGAITPEEVALHIDARPGVLAFADGVIRGRDGRLHFVPDSLLGDDPEEVKRGLRAALRRLLEEQEFDALLLAHGEPAAEGGRAELAAFVG